MESESSSIMAKENIMASGKTGKEMGKDYTPI